MGFIFPLPLGIGLPFFAFALHVAQGFPFIIDFPQSGHFMLATLLSRLLTFFLRHGVTPFDSRYGLLASLRYMTGKAVGCYQYCLCRLW